MGGEPAGRVQPTEHELAFWEKRVDAMMMLLGAPERKLVKVDAVRRAIEALPPDAYDKMVYYERWMWAITDVLLARGVINADELGRKMHDIEVREGLEK